MGTLPLRSTRRVNLNSIGGTISPTYNGGLTSLTLHDFIILMTLSIGTLGYNEIQMILPIGASGYNISEYILKLQMHQHHPLFYDDIWQGGEQFPSKTLLATPKHAYHFLICFRILFGLLFNLSFIIVFFNYFICFSTYLLIWGEGDWKLTPPNIFLNICFYTYFQENCYFLRIYFFLQYFSFSFHFNFKTKIVCYS